MEQLREKTIESHKRGIKATRCIPSWGIRNHSVSAIVNTSGATRPPHTINKQMTNSTATVNNMPSIKSVAAGIMFALAPLAIVTSIAAMNAPSAEARQCMTQCHGNQCYTQCF